MKENIVKTKIIANYTFKEIVKSKILLNTLILGLVLMLITFVAFSFTYGTPSRIALDFGLGMLSLSSVGIAIFIGVGLLSKEIESRTVYMIISRPVPRYAFILGKLLGLIGVLILNVLILSVLTLALYFLIGGEYSSLIPWAILFTICEAVLTLFLVTLISLVTTQTITVMMSIMIYISGHTVAVAQETLFAKNTPWLSGLLEIYHFVLPGFYKLNIKDFVLYKNSLSLSYVTNSILYVIFYSIFLILLSIVVFEKKNID